MMMNSIRFVPKYWRKSKQNINAADSDIHHRHQQIHGENDRIESSAEQPKKDVVDYPPPTSSSSSKKNMILPPSGPTSEKSSGKDTTTSSNSLFFKAKIPKPVIKSSSSGNDSSNNNKPKHRSSIRKSKSPVPKISQTIVQTILNDDQLHDFLKNPNATKSIIFFTAIWCKGMWERWWNKNYSI